MILIENHLIQKDILILREKRNRANNKLKTVYLNQI